MQALKVTVDAKIWLSLLRDIAKRAILPDCDRRILLGIDPAKGLLTLVDEDTDSSYKISIPICAGQGSPSVYCRVQAGKLAPMEELFRFAQGDLHLTFRSATLSFQSGNKRFHVPNFIVEAPVGRKESFFSLSGCIADSPPIARFLVSGPGILLEAAELSQDPAVAVRTEEGRVCIGKREFPADCCQSAVFHWPRGIICRRLSQLPEDVPVSVQVDERSAFFIASSRYVSESPFPAPAGAVIVREIFVRPFPATTLYISRPDGGKRPGEREHGVWSNAGLASVPVLRGEPSFSKALSTVSGNGLAESGNEPGAVESLGSVPEPPGNEPVANPEKPPGAAMLPERSDTLPDRSRGTIVPEESGLEALERLPGLHFVKKQIRDIARFAVFEQKRAEILGIPANPPTLHMAFLGNPGTGKTMVARMLGRIFKELGLLEKGHVVEVDRQALVGAYMGHTEANLKKYVRNALGGILFVDEAYALYKKDSHKDFGMTAINGLVKVMEDYRHNLAVILAGYKSEMRELLSANPGLGERIPFHVEFPDYTEEELGEIAEYIALRERYVLSGDAREALIKQALRRKTDETFGNARTVRNLIEQAKIRHAVRSAESAPAAGTYTTLTADDFLEEGIPAGESLENVLAELDRLVGLQQIKQLVRQIVDVLRLEKQRANLGLTNNPVTLHMAFTGNPGTGKTTVARLLGKILRALDLLPKGHFVEVSRKDLVAGFIGQTALKTAEKIKEAMGGVLFVDEAYALAGRSREDFGLEALTTLIKEMEDKKGLFTVILAGYTQQMEDLFKANPGLKSRMRFTLHFPDYTAGELVEIVKRKAEESCYRLSEAAEEKLWMYFIRECSSAETDFGNGRLAEKIFEHAKLKMSARLAQTLESVDRETLITITEEDIEMDC